MSDRLAELQRQRALIAEHLAWLDREIAAASPASSPPTEQPTDSGAVTAPSPSPAPLDPAAIIAAATAAKSAAPSPAPHSAEDELAAKHLPTKRQPADIQQDVRRGCLLYFSIAALLVIGLCALLVWVSRAYNKSHPPAPAQPESEQVEQRH